MRVACELCATVAEATLAADGAQLAVTCAACGGTFTAALTANVAATPPIVDGPRCAKCEAPSSGGGPCPRCGLAPEHADAWRARAAEPPTASLGAAWDAVVAAWSDEPTHERAAAVAIETGDYAWLAARYRAIVRTRGDDAIARRQLDRLSRRAEATLRATAAPPADGVRAARIPWVVLVVAALVIGLGLVYARHVIGERDEQPGRVRPAERIAPSRTQR